MTLEKLAQSAQVGSIDITGAIKRLVALIAVGPGSGRWRNEYLMCLPKTAAATLPMATVEDAPPI